MCKLNAGRLSNVEGTERETAWGNREETYAECGRTSMISAFGVLRISGRVDAVTVVNSADEAVNEGEDTL